VNCSSDKVTLFIKVKFYYDRGMKNQKDDYKEIENQLAPRSKDKIVVSNSFKNSRNLFLTSSCDYGVIRNGGRRGANFGPKSILNSLSSMSASLCKEVNHTVIRGKTSEVNFDSQQIEDTNAISSAIKTANEKNIWHLGGGHDHVYPLLKAISESHEKICVINIDAHLDTRVDELSHSGTPFRQFANETKGEFLLYQLGIHRFANTQKNYDQLKNGEMKVYTTLQMQKESANFANMNLFLEREIVIPKDYVVVLSLDCDAIDSMTMEAVSAVNHDGLSLRSIKDIFSWYFSRQQAQMFTGIYEYNPVFDNLSNKGSRAIASLIESFL
jgi:formiminoglutamase